MFESNGIRVYESLPPWPALADILYNPITRELVGLIIGVAPKSGRIAEAAFSEFDERYAFYLKGARVKDRLPSLSGWYGSNCAIVSWGDLSNCVNECVQGYWGWLYTFEQSTGQPKPFGMLFDDLRGGALAHYSLAMPKCDRFGPLDIQFIGTESQFPG